MAIWAKEYSVKELNDFAHHSIEEQLGIQMVELGDQFLAATMPVDHRTRQPFGILHGGASVVLAETLGSMATYLCLESEQQYGVGIEVNANHLRSVSEGIVRGVAHPIHLGKRIHVWEIKIYNSDEELVCISRLTLAIVNKR